MIELCKHFKRFDENTREYFETSDGYVWNAWHVAWEGGKMIYCSFITGGMMEYMTHLAEHPECIPAGFTLADVKKELNKIEKEWELLRMAGSEDAIEDWEEVSH